MPFHTIICFSVRYKADDILWLIQKKTGKSFKAINNKSNNIMLCSRSYIILIRKYKLFAKISTKTLFILQPKIYITVLLKI